jgi:hypothetical protein
LGKPIACSCHFVGHSEAFTRASLHVTGRNLHQQFGTVCENVYLFAKYICTSSMVTMRSEALRGPWGNRTREHPERGETSSKPSPTLEVLNERIAQMEKEMYELEKKNAALQRRHVEDSHLANLQPDEKEEWDDEEQAGSQGGREENKKNHDTVD